MPDIRPRPADRPPARGRIRLPASTRRSARLEAILLGPALDAATAADGLRAGLEAARVLQGGRLVVTRLGPSPLPRDRRRCAFVAPT